MFAEVLYWNSAGRVNNRRLRAASLIVKPLPETEYAPSMSKAASHVQQHLNEPVF
jgi:hypothetical protein